MDFTLSDFLRLLKKTWWIILLAAIVCAAVTFTVYRVVVGETYTSNVVVMLDYKDDAVDSTAQDDFNYSVIMANNCKTILSQNKFYNALLEKLPANSKAYTMDNLKNSITFATLSGTSALQIDVTNKSAGVAYEIAQRIEELIITDGYIAANYPNYDIAKTKATVINSVEKATKADESSFLSYTVIGGIIGLLIAAVIIYIIDRRAQSKRLVAAETEPETATEAEIAPEIIPEPETKQATPAPTTTTTISVRKQGAKQ